MSDEMYVFMVGFTLGMSFVLWVGILTNTFGKIGEYQAYKKAREEERAEREAERSLRMRGYR